MNANMNANMNAQPQEPVHYPGLEPILGTIAGWITRYRQAMQSRAELRQCGTEEVARIAHDLSVSPAELASLASKGPSSALLLDKMLVALGVDREDKHVKDPRMMRDLQRLCFACDHKRQCAHDLVAGTAKEHYHEYCPNAYTLDILMRCPQ